MSKEKIDLISPEEDDTSIGATAPKEENVSAPESVPSSTEELSEGEQVIKKAEEPAAAKTRKSKAEPELKSKKESAQTTTVISAPVVHSASRYQNEVTLRGEIVKMILSKKTTIVTVRTRATMTVDNYPTVIFFGDNGVNAAQFKEGQRVVIKATLQSYDKTKLRKGQSDVLIVGLTIKDEAEVSEADKEPVIDTEMKPIETIYRRDENIIDVRGQILAIECDKNNNITITIRMVTGGRWSIVKFPYYARDSRYFLKHIYVKQFIRASGTVQTANIPVEPEETPQEKAEDVEKAATVRMRSDVAPRLKTRKKQFFILYDVFAIES